MTNAKTIRTFADAVRVACREAAEQDPRALSVLSIDAGHADNWFARKLVDGLTAARPLSLLDVDELAGVLSIPAASIAARASELLAEALADVRARRSRKSTAAVDT